MLKSQPQAFLEDIKVLVIDDNAYMRGLMISILHSLGVRGLADSGGADRQPEIADA